MQEDSKLHARIRKWKHACFALDIKAKKVRFIEGGNIHVDDLFTWSSMETLLENKPVNLNGMLLGTHQENNERQMFISYTSVNIFSRFLSDNEMSDITSCKDDSNGDYLAWNETKWTLSGEGAFTKNISSDIVCEPRNGTIMLFPAKVTGLTAEETCRKLKGTMWAPQNEEEHARMYNLHQGITKLKEGNVLDISHYG